MLLIRHQPLRALIARAIRFGISGALSTLVAYGAFMLGLKFWHYTLATVFSWIVSVGFGFLINRWFTFGIKGREHGGRHLVLFLVGAVLQLGLALVGYHVLFDIFHLGPTVAFVINLVFTSSFSFCYMSLVAFRRSHAAHHGADETIGDAQGQTTGMPPG